MLLNTSIMKFLIFIFLVIAPLLSIAQKNFLVIQKNNSEFSKEIKENKRIKIETKEGKKFYGRFTVVDSLSIMIENEIVLLDDIIKLKRKSLFIKICNPLIITTGLVFVTFGVAGAIAGGYGYIATVILLPPGISISALSLISNNHTTDKWNYKIKTIQ
jgi:small nuclear ribonucleoprotein (snRNP)-like protein